MKREGEAAKEETKREGEIAEEQEEEDMREEEQTDTQENETTINKMRPQNTDKPETMRPRTSTTFEMTSTNENIDEPVAFHSTTTPNPSEWEPRQDEGAQHHQAMGIEFTFPSTAR